MLKVSEPVSVKILNVLMINLPDLLVLYFKKEIQDEVNEPVEKKLEVSEYGPLSYVAEYVIGELYQRSKFNRSQIQIQLLLLSLKSSAEMSHY